MLISNIVSVFNQRLAGELFEQRQILIFLDSAIDRINTRLNTNFPVFSELPSHTIEYDYFPDRYIRTVVVTGAVWRFYQMDEEGATVAPEYEREFYEELFHMERDYLPILIADGSEYLADPEQGQYHFERGHPLNDNTFFNATPYISTGGIVFGATPPYAPVQPPWPPRRPQPEPEPEPEPDPEP